MASLFNKISGAVSGSHPEPKEQSLGTILPSHDDRSEFLLLLANCMGFMRKQVLDNFDPDFSGVGWDRSLKSAQSTKGVTDEPTSKEPATEDAENQELSADEIEEKRRKAYERRVEELSSTPMVQLKDATIEHFDTWRDRVIQRLGEVINQHKVSETNTKDATTTQQDTAAEDVSKSMRSEEADKALHHLYPPQQTILLKLPQPQRVLLLHSLLLVLLSLESYTAESRVLMLHVTSSLSLPLKLLVEDETHVAKGLLESAKNLNADEETKKDAEAQASSRKWKVGLGAAAGAVLIGVTGGLAAPLLAAGVGSVMGGVGLASTATAGYLGAMAGSAPLVGALFGAYGGRMTARMVDEYAREVEDFAFIPIHKQHFSLRGKNAEENARHLRVAIAISGYLTEEAEVVSPWRAIGTSIEGFALRYELKSLLALGSSLTSYIKSYAWSWAKKEIISRTIFATLSSAIGAALALPYGMAKATKLVDNPFNRARSRSEKAGRVLAHALIAKVQGERPVTLLGYSLGARVIYTCLDELAEKRAFGLVESVVLAGAAVPSDSLAWRKMRSVVSGRLINAYSTNDYLLAFLYRTVSLQYGVAGLQAVHDVPGIENIDVSDLVDGHTQYRFMMAQILQTVGLEDIDAAEVERQIKEMKAQKEKDEAEAEKARKEAGDQGKTEDQQADELEKEIERKMRINDSPAVQSESSIEKGKVA